MTSINDLPALPGGYQSGDVVAVGRGGIAYSLPVGAVLLPYDVRWYKAKGDGITIDSTALQAAADAIGAAGGVPIVFSGNTAAQARARR